MAERVVLAMSGGVDSSAAAYLLRQQGYEIIGLFMRSGATEPGATGQVCQLDDPNVLPVVNMKTHKQGCCSASDAVDARRVADELDIPFHALNFEDAFGRIKDYFVNEYLAGRTPNPCVQCNNWLKFGKLWEFAQQVGAEKIASGHYAQILPQGENDFSLQRGIDLTKDQSYVLFGIEQALLEHILFPVGGYTKKEIRQLARQTNLQTADKKDSQEICFIPDNDYAGFVNRYVGKQETEGEFVDTEGKTLGKHAGYERFTIGQRRGLGIAFGEPRFVLEIRPQTRQVVLGTYEQLGRTGLTATDANWLCKMKPRFRCQAQIRYQAKPAACEVELLEENRFRIYFEEAQFGIAPGQAVVCYEGNRVLGGGWIQNSFQQDRTL